MKDFCIWFIQEFPSVLLEPPISAFVGLALVAYCVKIIYQMFNIS